MRRRVFAAAFLGWMLDGYDYTILTFVFIDIARDFDVDRAALGVLLTATLFARLIGGYLAGAAADRYGRKLPLMFSIVWFSVFAGLSGLAPSYWALFTCRLLFGLGMGGEWAAGMPLVLEHFPEQRRGLVLGALQGAFSWGFILAAAAFQYLTPQLGGGQLEPWRWLLLTSAAPALLVFWIRSSIPESPAWLAGRTTPAAAHFPLRSLMKTDVLIAAACLACCMLMYRSMSDWYGTLLRERSLTTLPFMTALNAGGIVGAAFWGLVGDTRIGHRRAIAIGCALAIAITPMYLTADSSLQLFVAAGVIGATGAGVIGLAPSYIGRLLPASARATGWGIVYHVAAATGAIAPYAIGEMQDAGYALPVAMRIGISVPALLAVVLALVPIRSTRTPVSRKP